MTGGALRLVLGDQLSRSLSALEGLDCDRDTVLMAEVTDETTYVPHHPKKIAFVLSAMRHFAQSLRDDGVSVRYVRLDDADNSGSLTGELTRAETALRPDRTVMTECGEWRLDAALRGWAAERSADILDDTRFLASKADFSAWAASRKQLRMEYFYREMRRRHRILIEPDGGPTGGKWNYDADNRKPFGETLFGPPPPPVHAPDAQTDEVLDLVERRFPNNAGRLRPFDFAVDAAGAEACADAFFRDRLARFGDFQDAMSRHDPVLHHAFLGLYLNAGLLDPLDLCRRAEHAYRTGTVPLNSAEGFIRQILGWREYVRGLYWLKMPDYGETNFFAADRTLPEFFWTGDTDMACLAHSIGQTLELSYAHHIQRLMVIGNFALLVGLAPKSVCEWYLSVYADAYEWVELPNTHGMALFADGGVLGSKPYAASGKYIARMSDYCTGCRYDPQRTDGPDACPYNYLYWDFLIRNADKLDRNPRMRMIYRNLDRMNKSKRTGIRRDAHRFLESMA